MTRHVLKCLSILALVSACSIDKEAFTPAIGADQLLSKVKLEFNAYNLAMDEPYNTVQLRVSGISGSGEIVDQPVTYSVANPALLEVSSTGLVRALAPTAGTVVHASMTYNGLTRTDSAFIAVIDGSPVIYPARVAIEPVPGDSAKFAVGGHGLRDKTMLLIRADSSGDNMSDLRVAISSADTSIAKVVQSLNNVTVRPVRPGRTTFHVSTYAYGIALHDSISFLVGWPLGGHVDVYARYLTGSATPILDFHAGRFTVGIGSCILWQNFTEIDVDIEFETPELVDPPVGATCLGLGSADINGGNIAPFRTQYSSNGSIDIFSKMRGRTFNTAGVYRYYSKIHGTSGEIIVCDELNDSTCSPENYKWGALD